MNTIALLTAAKHALLSYAHGNASPDLATQIASQIEGALKGTDSFGLTVGQEPKYTIDRTTGRIVNRATGVAIPDDEPIMIFRGQDVKARAAIRYYVDSVTERGPVDGNHKNVCFERYQQFITFAERHPERMKEPDSPREGELRP